jgi:TRAP-type transport system periplasmic protein
VKNSGLVWRLLAVVAALALAFGLAACGDDDDGGDTAGGGGGGDAQELTLAYATTAQHPYGQAAAAFIEKVQADSGGSIAITPQPSYPASEIQLLADVRSGAVPMATISTAVWDTADITAFQALQAPFLITNYDLEREVLTGDIGRQMASQASEQAGDLVVLTIHEGGLRKPLTKRPATSPADFEGLKIRSVQSEVLAAGLRALGAEPTPIPLPEVFQALQNGTVDGMEANLGLIAGEKFYEVAKNVTGNVNFWPFPTALVINRGVWDSLSEEQRTQMQAAADTLPAASLDIVSARSTLPQDLVNCGVRFVSASPSDLEALSKAGAAAVSQLAPESQEFVSQIQALKDEQPAGAAPPPFPSESTGECTLGG